MTKKERRWMFMSTLTTLLLTAPSYGYSEYSYVYNVIIAFIAAGGIGTITTYLVTKKKLVGELKKMQAETARVDADTNKSNTVVSGLARENDENIMKFYGDKINAMMKQHTDDMEYIRNEMTLLRKQHKEEIAEMKTKMIDVMEQNKKLVNEISAIERDLRKLVSWVFGVNMKYRHWLEKELKLLNPNIQIPECEEAPAVFQRMAFEPETFNDSTYTTFSAD
jgi:hypothetical protein